MRLERKAARMRVWSCMAALCVVMVPAAAGAVEQPASDQAPAASDAASPAPAAPELQAPAETPAAPAEPAAPAPAAAEPLISPPPSRPATPEDAVRATLDGTVWQVQVTPLGGEGKPSKDTISFTGGQVSSANQAKAGYAETNYTVTIHDDGTASWETMQSAEGKGVVFWRGEVGGPNMRGVMSRRPVKGPTEDYGFFGQETSGKIIEIPAPKSDAAAAPASVQAAPAPAAAPSVPPAAAPAPTSGKSKKKGWF